MSSKALDADALRKAFGEMRAETRALRARLVFLEVALGVFVPETEIDERGGNPIVPFRPSGWRGDDMKGRPFSECTPEFLDFLSETLTYMGNNPKKDKEKYAGRNKHQAAVARTWARRLRRLAAQKAAQEASPPPQEPAAPPPTAATTPSQPPPAGTPADDDDDLFADDDPPDSTKPEDDEDLFGNDEDNEDELFG